MKGHTNLPGVEIIPYRDATQSNWAIAGLSLLLLLASLSTSITTSALPTMGSALNAPFSQVQWIVLAYLLSVTTLIVTAGYLGDLVGRRKLLLMGIQLFTVASLASGCAPSLGLLIVARVLQGIGAALMMSLTLAIVTELVPKEKTGSAVGLLGTMTAVGTAAGPTIGGILVASYGWRSIFILIVPLGFFAYFLNSKRLPPESKSQRSKPDSFDWMGTLFLGSSLAAFALAMTLGSGTFDSRNVLLLGTAIVALGLFIRVEMHSTNPLVPLQIFRNPKLNTGLLSSATVSTVMMAMLIIGPFYLSGGLGLDPMQVGLSMSVGPVVVALSGVMAGRLTDHFGSIRMSMVGLAVLLLGTILLSASSISGGIGGYLVPIVISTTGYSLFQTANTASVMASVVGDQRGSISGLLNLSRNLGFIVGASGMGTVYTFASSFHGESNSISASAAIGMKFTFAVAAGIVVSTLILSLVVHRARTASILTNAGTCQSH